MRLLPKVVLLAICAATQSTFATNVKAVPELRLAQLLQAPQDSGMTLASLRGKAVVLEFWATWCGGCVAQIPHLNALATQFRDQPVVFLSVTDENPETVKAFLKKRPMKSWIGIDSDGATMRNFGIEVRPQTFLIDRKGNLWARISPDRLDAARIKRLLAGAPAESDAGLATPKITPMELVRGVPTPFLQVSIRPAAPSAVSGFSPGAIANEEKGRVEYFGMTLNRLLAMTEHVREDRIVAPEWATTARYDVSSVVPEGREHLRTQLLNQMLQDTFELQTVLQSKPATVFVLTCAADCKSKLQPATVQPSSGFLPNPGHFIGGSTEMSRLTVLIEHALGGVEVLDETGLSGSYKIDLSWDNGSIESLRRALQTELGLELTKETRNRDFIVIKSATEPMTW